MVKEGAHWFSASSTTMKTEPMVVGDGATVADFGPSRGKQRSMQGSTRTSLIARSWPSQGSILSDEPRWGSGIAQITPATAQGWGVDASNPVASLHAAAQQMAGYVERFGNYPMALAAYNAGPRAVERFGGVPPYAETQNYVSKILGSG